MNIAILVRLLAGHLASSLGIANEKPAFELPHPSGLLIRYGLPEADVGAIPGVRRRDMRNGYVWYDLPRAEIAGQMVAISICFFNGTLNSLSLAVEDEKLYGASWGDWSAEKERARVEAIRRWFADVGYPVGAYGWGIVYAETDMKTGDGCGGVRFRT
jgi:hypothetical protein